MRKHTPFLAVILIVGWLVPVAANGQTTWHVDDNTCPAPGMGTLAAPFCSIQAGINAAINGDTVLVAREMVLN